MTLTSTPLSQPTTTRAAAPRTPWRTIALVAGDALSFLVFAGVGRASHQEATGLGAVAQIAATAVPFALGWFVVSPWIGAFRRSLTEGVVPMLRRTELAWLCVWPAAMLLRWALVDRVTPITFSKFASFALVVLISNAVFLSLWRGVFAWATRRVRW